MVSASAIRSSGWPKGAAVEQHAERLERAAHVGHRRKVQLEAARGDRGRDDGVDDRKAQPDGREQGRLMNKESRDIALIGDAVAPPFTVVLY